MNTETLARNGEDEEDEEPVVRKILAQLPEGTAPEVIEMITQIAYYSGPVPHPTMFASYQKTLPGSADRLLTLAENEQKIRKQDNAQNQKNDRLRIWFSFIVSLVLVIGAVYSISIGQAVAGCILGSFGLVGTIRAFLDRR